MNYKCVCLRNYPAEATKAIKEKINSFKQLCVRRKAEHTLKKSNTLKKLSRLRKEISDRKRRKKKREQSGVKEDGRIPIP